MQSTRWILLLALVLTACGGDEPSREGAGNGDRRDQTSPTLLGELGPDMVRLMDWELYPASPVRHALLVGQAVDPDGKPVAHARATLVYRCDLPFLPPRPGETFDADEKGVFRLEDVPLNALVFVEKEGFGGRIVPVPVLLPEDEGIASVFLAPGAAVSGFAHFGDGSPAGKVELVLSCPSPEWYRVVRTDAEGRFHAADVPDVPLLIAPPPGKIVAEPRLLEFDAGAERHVDYLVSRRAALEGRLQDAVTGAPIPGGMVRSLIGTSEGIAVADGGGRFRLEGAHLPMLFAVAAGYAERPVQWNPDGENGLDLLIVLDRGGTIRGRVVSDRGAPLAGYRIMGLVAPDGPGSRLRGPLTGEDGTFEYSWVALPEQSEKVALLAQAAGTPTAIGPIIELGRGQVVQGVEFVVPGPCRAIVRALDDGGEPWARAGLSMEEILPESLPEGLRNSVAVHSEAMADSSGRATLTGLRPGSYQLTVWPRDRLPFSREVTVKGVGDTVLPDVIFPTGRTLRGTVASHGGEFAVPPGLFVVVPGSGDRIPIRVDPDGSFAVSGLEDRNYILQCSADRHEPITLDVKAGEEDIRIRPRALGSILVTLKYADELPPEGTIEVLNADPTAASARPWRKKLAGDGAKVLYDPLPPGDYYVRVTGEEQVGAAGVRVDPGTDSAVEIALARAVHVTGRVVRSGGELALDVGVELDAGKIWGTRGVRTDDRGTYRSPALPSGEVTVRSHPFGHPATEKSVAVGDGEEAEVDLELKDGATVDASVTDMDGEAMEGVAVTLHNPDGEQARCWVEGRRKAVTDADGKIKLIGIPPGRYLLTFFVSGDWRERMSIELVDGETWNNNDLPVKLER